MMIQPKFRTFVLMGLGLVAVLALVPINLSGKGIP